MSAETQSFGHHTRWVPPFHFVVLPILLVNLFWSLFAGPKAGDSPWGDGATTLEWTLSSPPPYHQFETLPVID